ncbi:lytic transglycosylase domain-containing protein [Ornithinimicrobium sp. F0845]|uniref:aggregation-promoting factor C-terminal-like domain-containing protein n=1 Tax=Ornithinimicrobium sp. F0845 TaxID=2926412 RepID=UPI001FF582F1|nr:lytic transglycosylase domain-containing protein [Ornithinimicrobium sp. F0845]MCK0112279.1 lytic transglycosylase domain-containing protein [Ornithinimicrobium sp. F0845]
MSNAPEISVLPSSEEADSGRHRPGRRLHRGATALTAVIAAGAMAMAAYAAVPSSTTPTMDADGLANSIAETSPFVGDAALRNVADGTQSPLAEAVAKVEEQISASSLHFSTWSARKAGDVATEKSEEIAAERAAAERRAAEEAAAAEAAERAAAEERAAEEEAQQAAARSQERAEAPAEEAAPAPAPEPAPAPSGDPRSIARNMLGNYGWSQDQFGCLDSLWMRESGWSHTATNPSSGAYGIPQSLPASKMASAGADYRTNPATQIRWGLGYIQGRYGSPCAAWAHSQSVGWY